MNRQKLTQDPKELNKTSSIWYKTKRTHSDEKIGEKNNILPNS